MRSIRWTNVTSGKRIFVIKMEANIENHYTHPDRKSAGARMQSKYTVGKQLALGNTNEFVRMPSVSEKQVPFNRQRN